MPWPQPPRPMTNPGAPVIPRPLGPDLGKPQEHPPQQGPAKRLPTSNTGANTVVPESDMPKRKDNGR